VEEGGEAVRDGELMEAKGEGGQIAKTQISRVPVKMAATAVVFVCAAFLAA